MARPLLLQLLALAVLATGCPLPPDGTPHETCAVAWELPSGTVQAQVSSMGPFETVEGRFSTNDGLGISASDGALSITLSTSDGEAGRSVNRAVDRGNFPLKADIGLRSEAAGYALVYLEDEAFVSQRDGWLMLAGMDGDELVGCFELRVTSLDGEETAALTSGQLHVPRL